MGESALQEEFFSAANISWFALGILAEVMFLGVGVTPGGMELGANIAQAFGMIDPISTVTASTGEAVLAF